MRRMTTVSLLGALALCLVAGCGSSQVSPAEDLTTDAVSGTVTLEWFYQVDAGAEQFEVWRRPIGPSNSDRWTKLGMVSRAPGSSEGNTRELYSYQDSLDLTPHAQYLYRVVAIRGEERVEVVTREVFIPAAPGALVNAGVTDIQEVDTFNQVLEALRADDLATSMREREIMVFGAVTQAPSFESVAALTSHNWITRLVASGYRRYIQSYADRCTQEVASYLVNEQRFERVGNEDELQLSMEDIYAAGENEAFDQDAAPQFGDIALPQGMIIGRLMVDFTDGGHDAQGQYVRADYEYRLGLRDSSTNTYVWTKTYRWYSVFRD